tara:strand:- start:19923 stop:20192 length:270 start_codon:yes stop_codon:yes gene_type:complete
MTKSAIRLLLHAGYGLFDEDGIFDGCYSFVLSETNLKKSGIDLDDIGELSNYISIDELSDYSDKSGKDYQIAIKKEFYALFSGTVFYEL